MMASDLNGPVLEHTIGSDGLVFLRLRDRDVRIRGIDGGTVRLRLPTGGSLEAFEIERGEGSLSIVVGPRSDHELALEVPAGASIVAEASSSDITADGLVGDQRFRTASGDLSMRGVRGTVTVESMSGGIQISAHDLTSGDLRSVSGDVGLRAGTVNGLRATTTSGDLRVSGHFDDPGPFVIETVSGDIELAPAGDARIEFRTISGDVRSDVVASMEQRPGRRSFTIGAAGPTFDVRSTSGDLHLTGPGGSPTASGGSPAAGDGRLAALRALERGEIDIAQARLRLDALATDAEESDRG